MTAKAKNHCPELSTTRKRFPRVLLLAAVAAAVVLVPSAWAASWSWTGTFSSSNPHVGPCIWTYSNQGEACSDWYTWGTSAVNNGAAPNSGELLVGFQNNSAIRGKIDEESVCCGSFEVHPSDLGMSGSLKAQTLYWSGSPYYATAWATG